MQRLAERRRPTPPRPCASTLACAAPGALVVNVAKSRFTTGEFARYGLFVAMSMFLPKGAIGASSSRPPTQRRGWRVRRARRRRPVGLYLTKAVKRFEHEPRGDRRLRTTPSAAEIDVCRWGLKRELALFVVALVAVAGRRVDARRWPAKRSPRCAGASSLGTRAPSRRPSIPPFCCIPAIPAHVAWRPGGSSLTSPARAAFEARA